jgi:N-acetylglucosamine malate deacetylase 2
MHSPAVYRLQISLCYARVFFGYVQRKKCISANMGSLERLLGRTMLIVAHPDDETIGCGALLQRMREPVVVFLTDGAPRDPYFWSEYGSRENYAEIRAAEARNALYRIGVNNLFFLHTDGGAIPDQELYLNLGLAHAGLAQLITQVQPDSLLSSTYEGGHPDHDSCCFLVSALASEMNLPAWELPLYHRRGGILEMQKFVRTSGEEVRIVSTGDELLLKRAMVGAYRSQYETIKQFAPETETFRPMMKHDFSRPPHPGKLNYEMWGWRMNGQDLCRAFTSFQDALARQTRNVG